MPFMRRLFVIPLLVCAGCMSKQPDRNQQPWEPPAQLYAEELPKPVSVVTRELRTLYNDVLRNLMEPYFIGDPDLRKEYYSEMRQFIMESYPRDEFVSTMLELRIRQTDTSEIPAETNPEADFTPQHYRATSTVAAQVLPHVIRR